MKTKMKTILSIFMLTAVFYACKKDTPTPPAPVLDCNGIENGTAMIDDCGDCKQAYIYNYVSHAVEFLDDTTDVTLVGTTMLVMPGDDGDLYWNENCTDCMGILNGGAVLDGTDCIDCNGVLDGSARLDTCGDCNLAYIYNYVSHAVEFLDDTTDVTLVGTTMLVMPGDDGDPYWNTGCAK